MTDVLTHLETRLAAPGGAVLRDALIARAARLETTLRTRMQNGLPRQEFANWQSVADAAATAQAILASWPANDSHPAPTNTPDTSF